jgi:hypothetical protein
MFSPTSNSQPAARRFTWQRSVWQTVDRVVAFATLDAYGVEGPHDAADPSGTFHDRAPLQTRSRPRRPSPTPRTQHCVAPGDARPRRRVTSELARPTTGSASR